MSIHLPPPIDLYLKTESSGEVNSLSECFAPNATVRDESHTYEGLAAIRRWMTATKKKYNHTVTPLEISGTVLKAKLAGNFPGSPVTLEFRFALEGTIGGGNYATDPADFTISVFNSGFPGCPPPTRLAENGPCGTFGGQDSPIVCQ